MNCAYLMITLLLTGLPAQNNAVVYPPPKPPLVAPVPENAAWVISVSDSKDQPIKPVTPSADQTLNDSQTVPKDPGLKEIRVTKTGKLKRDILSYGSGITVENWYVDGALSSPSSNGKICVINASVINRMPGNELGSSQQSPGFTGIDWLNLKYYDQVVIYQGQPCYHYAIKMPPPVDKLDLPTDQKIESSPISSQAWINALTGLPVAYADGSGKLYTYHFLGPPTVPLTLPPAYQAAIGTYNKELDSRKRLDEAAAAFHRP